MTGVAPHGPSPAARPAGRPPHLHWRYAVLVGVGGMIGTAARAGVGLALPPAGLFPEATFVVNLVGAFLLGVLLETLPTGGRDVGARRAVRLFAGTGVLGGFTTYSAFAAETAGLLRQGEPLWAIGYALGTVLIGALAALAGIVAVRTVRRAAGGWPR